MLTRSSLSKPVARQRVGHRALHWRVASRRLAEHEFIADGTRLADGTRAGDLPLFPPVRRRHFRRRDSRAVIHARGEPGKLRILRYPATPRTRQRASVANRNLLAKPFSRHLSPFSTIYLTSPNPKPEATQ